MGQDFILRGFFKPAHRRLKTSGGLKSRPTSSLLYLTAQGCGFHLEPSGNFLN